MAPPLRATITSILLVLTSALSLEASDFPHGQSEEFLHRQRSQGLRISFEDRTHGLTSAVANSYSALNTLFLELPQALDQDFIGTNSTISSLHSSITGSMREHLHLGMRWPQGASDAGTRGSIRRQLQLQVDLATESIPMLPKLSGNSSNSTFIILAPNRTRRPNPMQNFQTYEGGWDFFSADYWASLAWSTVYGAAAGFVWLIFGVGVVTWAALTCLCCRQNWSRLRDRSLRYERSALTLPLLFMLLGVLLELVGFGLMVSGAVKFTGSAHSLTHFTVSEVERVSSVVLNVTPILRKLADSKSKLNYSVTADLRKKLLDLTEKVDNIAILAQQKSEQAGNSVNHVLDVLQDILFCVGLITVGFVLIGLIFTCCRLVVLSNIMTSIVWILCFVTWVLVTVFLFTWLFGGDTMVSLNEISVRPTDLSKFNVIVPCMDPSSLEALATFSRFVAYEVIVVVNATITENAPFIFELIKAPAGICNPFGPAPNFTYNNATCNGICSPYRQYCNGSVIDMDTLTQRIPLLRCNSTSSKQCIVANSVTSAVQQVSTAGGELVHGILTILPVLQRILRCAYISRLAETLQAHIGEMEYDTFLLWMGFLFVSLGAIFFGACAPIYVYRAVRCFGQHKGGQCEKEPINAGSFTEAGEYPEDYPGHHGQGAMSHHHAEPRYESGRQWSARASPY